MSDSIGRRLKAARVKKGLSQAELAERIGVSQAAIGQWERGQYAPRGKNLNVLNEVLGPGLSLEEEPGWTPPSRELDPSELEPEPPIDITAAHQFGERFFSLSSAKKARDHRFESKEFQQEVEKLLNEADVTVLSKVRLDGPSHRRWLLDLATEHCIVEFVHPISTIAVEREIESLLWKMIVLREAHGNHVNYVLIVREPSRNNPPSLNDETFEYRISKIMEDADSVGLHVFLVRSPLEATQLLVDLDRETARRI